MTKKMRTIENHVHGLDLIVEKDAGNEVRILTGNKSLVFWRDLRKLCDQTLNELTNNVLKEIDK